MLTASTAYSAVVHPNCLMAYPKGSPAKNAPTTFLKITIDYSMKLQS